MSLSTQLDGCQFQSAGRFNKPKSWPACPDTTAPLTDPAVSTSARRKVEEEDNHIATSIIRKSRSLPADRAVQPVVEPNPQGEASEHQTCMVQPGHCEKSYALSCYLASTNRMELIRLGAQNTGDSQAHRSTVPADVTEHDITSRPS